MLYNEKGKKDKIIVNIKGHLHLIRPSARVKVERENALSRSMQTIESVVHGFDVRRCVFCFNVHVFCGCVCKLYVFTVYAVKFR